MSSLHPRDELNVYARNSENLSRLFSEMYAIYVHACRLNNKKKKWRAPAAVQVLHPSSITVYSMRGPGGGEGVLHPVPADIDQELFIRRVDTNHPHLRSHPLHQ